jgi:hypothetical protein
MEIVALTHECGEYESPQLCARCGRVVVPRLRVPFPQGRAVIFEIDLDGDPPSIKRVTDTGERLSNIPWCDEAPPEWLEAFDLPDEEDGSGA